MVNTVYIEDVILVNFLTSFVICTLTIKSLKYSINKWRIFFCIILSVLTSVFSKYLNFFSTFQLIFKLLIGFVLSSVLCEKFKFKDLISCYITFMFNTFLMGGLTFAILFLGGKNLNLQTLSSNFLIIIVILVSIVYYFLFNKLLKVFYQKQHILKFCYQVELTINNNTQSIVGFLDSGNNLKYLDCPVCIISYQTLTKFEKNLSILDLMLKKPVLFLNSSYIKYNTVSGQGSMLVFTPDKLKIKLKDKYLQFSSCYIGVSLNEVSSSNSYSILLNSNLF